MAATGGSADKQPEFNIEVRKLEIERGWIGRMFGTRTPHLYVGMMVLALLFAFGFGSLTLEPRPLQPQTVWDTLVKVVMLFLGYTLGAKTSSETDQ